MLFHSPEFVFAFLPLVFGGYLLAHRLAGWDAALGWLAASSLFFYGQWSLWLAGLLLGSILVNYGLARAILQTLDRGRVARSLLIAGVTVDLGLLGYFKYTNFFLDNLAAALGTDLGHAQIILPVGISFYTFIQIGFLVEVYNRQIESFRFGHYLVFGSFFPCITAGPIILQRDIMPQLSAKRPFGVDPLRITVGLTVFLIGLTKKLVLADNISPFADAVFDGVGAGGAVGPAVAWTGALTYTLQLYFDFSGYSDMALGLGHLFGLNLPLNFNSPLKASSISDFWRRWHMTMTRFFTNYLYSPMAMTMMRRSMRQGHSRPHRFLLATAIPVTWTFVLAGLWHGAGWTFILFGLIHGLALAVNHGWREARLGAIPAPLGWALTMAVVIAGLVVFRAPDLGVAFSMLGAMVGMVSPPVTAAAGLATAWVEVDLPLAAAWIGALGLLALAAPNSQQIMRRFWYSSDPQPEDLANDADQGAGWRPTVAWGIAGAVLLAVALGSLSGDTAFVYYQF